MRLWPYRLPAGPETSATLVESRISPEKGDKPARSVSGYRFNQWRAFGLHVFPKHLPGGIVSCCDLARDSCDRRTFERLPRPQRSAQIDGTRQGQNL